MTKIPQTFQESCIYISQKYLDAITVDPGKKPTALIGEVDDFLRKVQVHLQTKKEHQRMHGWAAIGTIALHSLMSMTEWERPRDEVRDEIIIASLDLMFQKQHDYGHGNITKFGEYGVLVRLSDKVERLKNLYGNSKDPSNESIVDSWYDILNYSIIAIALTLDIFTNPLDPEFEWTKYQSSTESKSTE